MIFGNSVCTACSCPSSERGLTSLRTPLIFKSSSVDKAEAIVFVFLFYRVSVRSFGAVVRILTLLGCYAPERDHRNKRGFVFSSRLVGKGAETRTVRTRRRGIGSQGETVMTELVESCFRDSSLWCSGQ